MKDEWVNTRYNVGQPSQVFCQDYKNSSYGQNIFYNKLFCVCLRELFRSLKSYLDSFETVIQDILFRAKNAGRIRVIGPKAVTRDGHIARQLESLQQIPKKWNEMTMNSHE